MRPRGSAGMIWLCSLRLMWGLSFTGPLSQAAPQPEIQLNLQVGYQGVVRVGAWLPVQVEAHNQGRHFEGELELGGDLSGRGWAQRIPFELPQGTRKRLETLGFCSTIYSAECQARLVSAAGGGSPRDPVVASPWRVLGRDVPWALVVGRSFPSSLGTWGPPQDFTSPHWTSIRPGELPESPLLWEAVDGLYLSSERARELSAGQVDALRAWLCRGGHLMVGLAEAQDLDYVPWLRELLPVEVVGMLSVTGTLSRIRWERRMPGEPATEAMWVDATVGNRAIPGALRLCEARAPESLVWAWFEQWPLVVSDQRGLGRVTVVLCDMERQPWLNWVRNSGRWHRLWGWHQIDGPKSSQSGSARDWRSPEEALLVRALQTDQIRSLPWIAVLALLVVYVMLIGPVDYRWTRRSRRPMATWIRLPAYALLFAVTVYAIGYLYRAGVSEWRELNVVDVDLTEPSTMVRGWTFVSLYSPSNRRYPVGAPDVVGCVREPWEETWTHWEGDRRSVLRPSGPGWEGEILVPVWTSRDWVHEWYASLGSPVKVQARQHRGGWTLEMENHLPQALDQVWLVAGAEACRLVPVQAMQRLHFTALASAMTPRKTALEEARRILDSSTHFHGLGGGSQLERVALGEAAVLASLGVESSGTNRAGSVLRSLPLPEEPPHHHVWLLAWVEQHRPLPWMARFRPERMTYGTLYRIRVPVTPVSPASYDPVPTSSHRD